MADVFSKQKRSQVMAAIRSKGNKSTELKLASILRAYGITGWRRHQGVPGKPDFIFRRARLAIFVDGCFWHGCPKHGRNPGSNQSYWLPKLTRNKIRDRTVSKRLRSAGWIVLRFWAHALDGPEAVAKRVNSLLSLGRGECKDGRHQDKQQKESHAPPLAPSPKEGSKGRIEPSASFAEDPVERRRRCPERKAGTVPSQRKVSQD
jgi:DNA mismatch endonuclease (patch repair protein)